MKYQRAALALWAFFACTLLIAVPRAGAQEETGLPQCDLTEVYYPKNIEFLGPAKSIEVGSIQFSYHDFGPLIIYDTPSPPPASPPAAAPAGADTTPPPLVLIHGFGSTQYDWPLDLLETLSQNRRVIIFDNPRIGFSNDSSSGPLTIEYMANATLALIEALDLNRPDLVGNSMGGDIALYLAAHHGDVVGAVAAVAASFGGPDAPQPENGLAAVLLQLEAFFVAKSAAYAAGAQSITSEADEDTDPLKLFFPQGSLDPAYCHIVRDFVSIQYAIGMLPFDAYAGYALPGGVYEEGIIPSIQALFTSEEALSQQVQALVEYHSLPSTVAALLPEVSNQILFISGIQDDVIPITTQVAAADLTPGAWLIQVPEAGHGVPFLDPAGFATTLMEFLDNSGDISPDVRNYYETPQSSASKARSAMALVAGFVASGMLLW